VKRPAKVPPMPAKLTHREMRDQAFRDGVNVGLRAASEGVLASVAVGEFLRSGRDGERLDAATDAQTWWTPIALPAACAKPYAHQLPPSAAVAFCVSPKGVDELRRLLDIVEHETPAEAAA
jgi:hypothetical protein